MLNKIVNDFIESQGKSLSSNGYMKLEDGLIIQWGTATININIANGYINQVFTWPTAFPNAIVSAVVGANDGVQSNGYTNYEIVLRNLTGATLRVASSSAIGVKNYTYIAIGY